MDAIVKYIEQIGHIKEVIEICNLHDVECHTEVYAIQNTHLAVRFHWKSKTMDKLEWQQKKNALCLLEGLEPTPLKPIDEYKLTLWKSATSWSRYTNSFGYAGGYAIYLERVVYDRKIHQPSEALHWLISSLRDYLKDTTLQEWESKSLDEEINQKEKENTLAWLKENAPSIMNADIALQKMMDLMLLQKGKTLTKALGGSKRLAEDNETLAEVAVIANQISNHTEETAQIISAFKKIANTLKGADKRELWASSWEARNLLRQHSNN